MGVGVLIAQPVLAIHTTRFAFNLFLSFFDILAIGVGIKGGAGIQTTNIATGASAADQVVNILSGNGSAGSQTVNIGTGTRPLTIAIGSGAATAGNTIKIGDGAAANIITSFYIHLKQINSKQKVKPNNQNRLNM